MVTKNVKILLIEDNAGDARLIREMLSEVPDVSFELENAKRLSTGLKHLAKETPDIILLDIGLPDSQGLDTLEKVYAQVKTVPIVVLTGLEDESVGIEAVQHGAQDYLVKGQIQSKVLWRVLNYSIERKRAGEMLRESEERYRTLFNSKLDGMCVIDEKMKVLLANRAAADMFGFDFVDELLNANPFDFIPLEEKERVLAALEKDMFENNLQQTNEFRLKTKSGKDIWVSAIGTLTEYQGKLAGLISFRDITDRKQAEEALLESREALRKMFESATDGISVIDLNGVIIDTNQRTVEMHGFSSRDELVGKSALELIAPGDRAKAVENMRQAIKQGVLRGAEYNMIRADGSEFPGELSTSVLKDASGNTVSHVSIARDITERKWMEKQIRTSRDQLNRIINSMVEVLMVMDTDHNIIDVNRSFWKYYGDEREDIVGRKCYEVLFSLSEPCSGKQRRCPLQTVLKTGKSFSMEHVYKTAEGNEFSFELSMFPLLDPDGNIEAVVEMQHDDTVRKSMEESLRLSEQNLRNWIENSPLGIRILDRDGNTLYANRALLDMWGYSSVEELEAVPAKQRYAPESYAEHMGRKGTRRWGDPDIINYEVSIVRSDGQLRHLSASTRTLMWGGERQFQVVYQDITERKQAELEYRTMVRTTMDGFWLTDMQGHFLDVNDASCNLIGYSRDELLNMSIPDVEAIEKSEETAKHIRKIEEVGHDRFETQHRRKDGGIVDVEISVNYLPVGGGRMVVFVRDITESKRMEEELRHNVERFKKAMEGVIQVIASIVEVRDPYTAGHQRRVAELACAIAEEMDFSEERIEEIRMAALIHDIGKIYVPAEILSKPSRLTEIEFSMIKSHPQVAYDILKSVDFPWPICKLVLQHHERINSSGYPGGLSGEDILTGAKILAVADVVEAMASHRPYRPALGLDKALDEISKNSGVLYDSEVADACLRVFNKGDFKFE
jgi:PAS domain S-box-containing protein/putative nucleotidyltransferase with HDIG domain